MKTYLESVADCSAIYKLAEGFADNNLFDKNGTKECKCYYKVSWRKAPHLELHYELTPYSCVNSFSSEILTLENNLRKTEIIMPKELNNNALIIEYMSFNPEHEKSVFKKYVKSNNLYLSELANVFQRNEDSNFYLNTGLLRSDKPAMNEFLFDVMRYFKQKIPDDVVIFPY